MHDSHSVVQQAALAQQEQQQSIFAPLLAEPEVFTGKRWAPVDLVNQAMAQVIPAGRPLTEGEQRAVRDYKTTSMVNRTLRGERDEAERWRPYIADLDSALSSTPVAQPLRVWRGFQHPGLEEAWQSGTLTGQRFHEPGYISTSLGQATARGYAAAPGAFLAEIVVPQGAAAHFFGGEDASLEVLLQRGMSYQVHAAEERAGRRYLLLEALPPQSVQPQLELLGATLAPLAGTPFPTVGSPAAAPAGSRQLRGQLSLFDAALGPGSWATPAHTEALPANRALFSRPPMRPAPALAKPLEAEAAQLAMPLARLARAEGALSQVKLAALGKKYAGPAAVALGGLAVAGALLQRGAGHHPAPDTHRDVHETAGVQVAVRKSAPGKSVLQTSLTAQDAELNMDEVDSAFSHHFSQGYAYSSGS